MIFLILLIVSSSIGLSYYLHKKQIIKNIKKASLWFLGLFSSIFFATCLCCLTRVQPGEVGVLVDMFGSSKGVEEKELDIGYHVVWPTQNIYFFPTFEQNHQWVGEEGFSFQTKEGLSVYAEIGISFNLSKNRIHELFAKYRRGMDEITHLFIRNNIRDAINRHASKMTIEELYGHQKEEFFKGVLKDVREELAPLGFNINHIYIIGKFGVPDIVMEALNRKIEATQRSQQIENEFRATQAEAQKDIAKADGLAKAAIIRATAESESNDIVNKSITPGLIRWNAVNKWNGELPKTLADKDISILLKGD